GTGWVYNAAANWNGGGLHYSPDYGFGEVDAEAAVQLSRTWPGVTFASQGSTEVPGFSSELLPDGSVLSFTTASSLSSRSFSHTFTITDGSIHIEHVQVVVSISNAVRSNLTITLTSPSGITSTLMSRPGTVMGQAADAQQYAGSGGSDDFTPAEFDYIFETV